MRSAESGNTRTDRGCVEDQPQRLERTRPLEYPGRRTVPPAAPGPADTGAVRFMVPLCIRKSEVSALHEPLVAADVRRLTLSQRVLREKDQSLVTSAPTLDWEVQAPMRVRKLEVEATHELTLIRIFYFFPERPAA